MAKAPAKAAKEAAPEETGTDEAAAAGKPAKNKMILMIVIGLVVVAISIGGTIAAVSMFGGDKGGDSKEAVAEGEGGEHAEAAKPAKAPLTYLPMEPAFLTNFTVNGRQRYLQVAITAVARDKEVIAAVQKHSPLIRNRIVMLLSSEQFDTLRTRAGREALQTRLHGAIQEVLKKEGTKGELDKLLFTNFVMQ
jgi:flagellar FliL protein